MTEAKRLNKVKVGGAVLLAGALFLAGTTAYFTDREEVNVSVTTGSVDLAVDAAWQDAELFKPGDGADLHYTVANHGNIAIDVREKIVIKSTVPMAEDNQAEFEVYDAKDLVVDETGAYVPVEGATPITDGVDRVFSNDQTVITYSLDEYALNGDGEGAEVVEDIMDTTKARDYVLVFDVAATNDFQDAGVTVELLAEAKQHSNTDADTWKVIETETVTIGGNNINAVPKK